MWKPLPTSRLSETRPPSEIVETWMFRGIIPRAEVSIDGSMSKAYRVEFLCPKSGHTIRVQRRCSKSSLSETEAMEICGKEEISCTHASCGWRGTSLQRKGSSGPPLRLGGRRVVDDFFRNRPASSCLSGNTALRASRCIKCSEA